MFIQRGWHGFARRDLWSLNGHLAWVIGESVDHLRVQGIRNGWGRPAELSDGEWNDILRRITAGMQAAGRLTTVRDREDRTAEEAARAEALELLVEWWVDLGS